MASLPAPFLTPEQYLEIDRSSERRSEYHRGEMFPIETAGLAHGRIQINLTVALERKLQGSPCQLVGPTVRVPIPNSTRYTYPDLIIACGQLELTGKHRDNLLNPTVLFEVLSESTEGFDRGEKFALYQSIPSLREYVLVSQDRVFVERYRRYDIRQWLYEAVGSQDSELVLESAGCSVPLHEIYSRVEFGEPAD